MRYLLIFIGAAVVAWLLALGIRAFVSERRGEPQASDDVPSSEPKRPAYRIK